MFAHISEHQLDYIKTQVPGADWGNTLHVRERLFDMLLEKIRPEHVVPGGGAFNTIRIMAQLRHSTGFCGGLGKTDSLRGINSQSFRRELNTYGISDFTQVLPDKPCGRSLYLYNGLKKILIFNPAAAAALNTINTEVLKKAFPKIIYMEGFIVPRYDLVQQVVYLKETARAALAIDLGAEPIVRTHRDFLLDYVLPKTLYVFGTEKEIAALGLPVTELNNYLNNERNLPSIIVMKKGPFGSTIYVNSREDKKKEIQPRKALVVDTGGAGDSYAGFFLSALIGGASVKRAARVASYGSTLAVSQFGGNISSTLVESVPKMFHTRVKGEEYND